MPLQSALTLLVSLTAIWAQVALALGSVNINSDIVAEFATGLADSGVQKADVTLKLDIRGDLSDAVRYTIMPKLVMAVDSELYVDDPDESNYSNVNGPWFAGQHGLLELSEAYVDFEASSGYWRLGKQQVVWGQADGLKVLDVINPQDYREFNLDDFEDSRISLWMLNAEFTISDDASLQLLLIPDATYSRFADIGTPYYITSSKYRPATSASSFPLVVHEVERPHHEVEVGARYRLFYAGWDLTLNYLHHRQDIPVIYRRLSASHLDVVPVYEKNTLFGATASNAFGNWVVRVEAGYSTDTYQLRNSVQNEGIANTPELSSVIGLDYRGISDWFISYQWFQSTLTDYEDDIIRERRRMQHTFLLRRSLLNETLEIELFTLYSDEDQDGQSRSKISYLVNDEVRIWAGVDMFYGDADGQFGQFNDTDRLVLGVEFGL